MPVVFKPHVLTTTLNITAGVYTSTEDTVR
jgi:hypothetical protein